MATDIPSNNCQYTFVKLTLTDFFAQGVKINKIWACP